MHRFLSICNLLLVVAVCAMGLNNNPVIGIIAQPYYEEEQYIAASYVKWIEASGGQVVPIPYNASDAYLDYLLLRLSGVLFPGGISYRLFEYYFLYTTGRCFEQE